MSYAALNELTMFNLAARTDGKNPPINPIAIAKINEEIAISGDNANEKESSENEFQLSVETEKN